MLSSQVAFFGLKLPSNFAMLASVILIPAIGVVIGDPSSGAGTDRERDRDIDRWRGRDKDRHRDRNRERGRKSERKVRKRVYERKRV